LLVGVVGGPRAMATIESFDDRGSDLVLRIDWATGDPRAPIVPVCLPITLLIGLPRPQTARKILQECTSLGVQSLWFFRSELGEKSYATSKLWSTDEWDQLRRLGAEQACSTYLPPVRHFAYLGEALRELPDDAVRVVFDPDARPPVMAVAMPVSDQHVLAIGSERGWSERERSALRLTGFAARPLGPRILRTETACLVALTRLASEAGLM
ncbi:MAG: RsmE family RNA methyltransferase, partial [Planctomycetota bacterium]